MSEGVGALASTVTVARIHATTPENSRDVHAESFQDPRIGALGLILTSA
jgi:hypothetical protein